jgi:aspartyl protease family protein
MPAALPALGARGRGVAWSAGARQAVNAGAAWCVLAAAIAFSLSFFNEIKDITRDMLGLAPIAAKSARPSAPTNRTSSGPTAEIRASSHGHYFARAEINGRPVDVLIDSGASVVALAYDDALRAGVSVRPSDYTQRVSTANGFARVAPVVLDRVSIGDVTVRNVPAAVSERGALTTSLLGMSFLGRLQRVDMRSGTLILQE